ncbi:uncharacterized protein LOC115223969 isoform X1 [Octopus sinensis]|uniref:Uncharacterized protein LOC115223969 isoform X1 n=1 Tax=Octopus sinensis TaxID=2607531 RepID=A0A6P7TGK9_9MOLL|nr:uncharacterized protein LOC115223969 isoform X1 [Octopus sinensis]
MAADLNRSSIPFYDYHQLPTKGITQSCDYINSWKSNTGKMPTSSETAVSSSRPKTDQFLCQDHYDLHAAAELAGCRYNSCSSNESFENNQSFPKISFPKNRGCQKTAGQNHTASANELGAPLFTDTDYPGKQLAKSSILNSQYPPTKEGPATCCKHSGQKEPLEPFQNSFNEISEDLSCTDVSFSKYVEVPYPGDCSLLPSTIRNPNKAIFTIDAKTSQILTANEMACALFGYNRADMICRCLTDLVQLKRKDQQTIMESYLQPSGQVISIAGKVVEAIDKDGLVLPVSLWMKRVDYNKKSRCLVAMEPIHRLICSIYFDIKGEIIRCDEKLSCFFGYSNNEDINGANITQLIPAFKLPKLFQRLTKNIKKQRATGKTLDGSIFPLTIHVHPIDTASDEEDNSLRQDSACRLTSIFEGVVCIFSTITGLITFFPDGTIHSINHHFALMLFGYSSSELIGKTISTLIPDFYSIVSSMNVSSSNHCNSSLLKNSVSETSTLSKKGKRKGSKRATLEGNIAHHKHQEMLKENQFMERNAEEKGTLDFSDWMKDVEELKPESSSTPYRSSKSLNHNEITPSVIDEDLLFLPSVKMKDRQHEPILTKDLFSNPEESSVVILEPDPLEGITRKPEESKCVPDVGIAKAHSALSVEEQQHDGDDGGGDHVCNQFEDGAKTAKDLKTSKITSIEDTKTPVESNLYISGNTENTPGEKLFHNKSLHLENTSPPDQNLNDKADENLLTEAIVIKHDNSFLCKTKLCSRTQSVGSELTLIESKMKALQVDCELLPSEFGSDNNLDNERFNENVVAADGIGDVNDRKKTLTRKREVDKKEPNINLINRMSVSLTESVSKQAPPSNYKLRRRRSFKALPPRKMCFERSKTDKMLASSEDSEEDSFELLEKEIQKSCQGKEYDEDLLDSGDILSSFGSSKKTEDMLQKSLVIPDIVESPTGSNKTQLSKLAFDNVPVPDPRLHETVISEAVLKTSVVKHLSPNYQKTAMRNSHIQRNKTKSEMDDVPEDSESVQENLSNLDEFTDGEFSGMCVHKDGSYIGINFAINPMLLESGELMFCMWVSQDLENASVASLRAGFTSCSNDESIHSEDLSCSSHGGFGGGTKCNGDGEESYPLCKAYDLNYQNLRTIGHGAFGFVVVSLNKSSDTEVIVKYILRSKVLTENWRDDPVHGRIPLEASMLTQLSHPNIVQVLDVFDSKDYVLMVMEKHGSGMDLFEFIEHKPNLDEPLDSYIFRQIVSAVAYLHRAGIVHRDLKDENIIVNEQFHIKLIDFGSAAYIEPEKMFATFCGTVEYCSPEVLMGNWYEGPELEVWSMGVTLYTLVYGENPFFTVDDILECNFNPPYQVSEYLTDLLHWMMLPDPADRMNIEELEHDTWVFQPLNIENYSWAQVMHHEPSMTTSDYNVNYEPVSYADIFSLSCAPRISSVRPFTRQSTRPHYLSY